MRDLSEMSDIASDTSSVYKPLPPRQSEQQQRHSSRPVTSRPQQRPPPEPSRSSSIQEKSLRTGFRRQRAVKEAARKHLAAAAANAAAAATATGDAYDVSRLTTSTPVQSASSQQWYGMMRQVILYTTNKVPRGVHRWVPEACRR